VCYAVLSHAYRWAVLAASLYLLYQFLGPKKLGPLCYLLVVGVLAAAVVWPAAQLLRTVHELGGLRAMKRSRVVLSLGVVLVVVYLVAVIRWPLKVESTALLQVEPEQTERVAVPAGGGFLTQLLVQDGQHVQAGDVLAVLTNPKLDIALRVNEADQALRRQAQQQQAARLAGSAREREIAEDVQRTDFELRSLEQEHRSLKREAVRLTLRAPRSGVVLGVPSREQVGQWQEAGAELCRVGSERALRAVLLVEPSEQAGIAPGSPARVRVHGGGARTWAGVVSAVSHVEAQAVPPQLSQQAGGPVATEPDPVSKQEKPRSQHYLVAVRLAEHDRLLHPGQLGRVQIVTGSETLWWRWRRFLATNFNWGL
jgi:multidrug resistance efflux pump